MHKELLGYSPAVTLSVSHPSIFSVALNHAWCHHNPLPVLRRAQVIKAISGKGAPACNCVALTGMTGEAKMFRAPTKPKA